MLDALELFSLLVEQQRDAQLRERERLVLLGVLLQLRVDQRSRHRHLLLTARQPRRRRLLLPAELDLAQRRALHLPSGDALLADEIGDHLRTRQRKRHRPVGEGVHRCRNRHLRGTRDDATTFADCCCASSP